MLSSPLPPPHTWGTLSRGENPSTGVNGLTQDGQVLAHGPRTIAYVFQSGGLLPSSWGMTVLQRFWGLPLCEVATGRVSSLLEGPPPRSLSRSAAKKTAVLRGAGPALDTTFASVIVHPCLHVDNFTSCHCETQADTNPAPSNRFPVEKGTLTVVSGTGERG